MLKVINRIGYVLACIAGIAIIIVGVLLIFALNFGAGLSASATVVYIWNRERIARWWRGRRGYVRMTRL